ncbi:MAG TPA: PAS domain-containing protein [Vicinamibacterales bacterium]|nr:PAS domain-containing protein [Vicinamibacterales bacterium]
MSQAASPTASGGGFYEAIVHSLGGIVWAADPATFQFSFVSEQAERILGYPVREWLEDEQFWQRHTHPDDVERCTAFWRDAALHGQDQTFEYRMLAADGRVVWLRDTVTVQADEEGLRLVGIMLDITEEKRREEAQRETDELYRFLTDHTSDVITLYDLNGRRVYASPSFERTFGLVPGTAFAGVHPDDRSAVLEAFKRVLESGITRTVTFRHSHADGSWRWCEAHGTMVPYRGEPHVLAVTREITERRRLEDQLRQAQKLEAIGLLAGGVAHDFNNLLTVILCSAELLAVQLAKDPLAHEVVEEIREACDRAVTLTQQLLAFSRKQVLHPTVIDLDEVIRNLAKMLRRVIGETIELDVRTSGALPPVLADAGQVQQVVTNLALNARDAMPNGGRLTIETSARRLAAGEVGEDLPPGTYAVVTVTDTGTGMTPEVLARAFEPFFTTKEPGKGTGLGLSTAYGIMKQSGGHIEMRSEPGVGSTFTLYFPETKEPPAAVAPEEKDAAERGTELVLLVEDEEQVRSLVARALQWSGYRVRAAANGREALELVREESDRVALVVTDVVMPGMSGPEMVRRLRESRPDLRVLYISGYAGDSFLRDRPEEGTGFLQKPFTTRRLLRRVRDMIDDHPRRRARTAH